MHLLVLSILAVAMPAVWGWLMHWLLGRFWKESAAPHGFDGGHESGSGFPFDYQI